MNLLWTILIGFVAGAVANFIMPGKGTQGFVMTTVLGIAGAWVGNWVFGMFGLAGPVGFVGSVIGAMIILAVYRALNK